jgi:hypothetical protein
MTLVDGVKDFSSLIDNTLHSPRGYGNSTDPRIVIMLVDMIDTSLAVDHAVQSPNVPKWV